MSKKLLIVESPGKIKTISKFLGPDFIVISTVGHIKDLPQRSLGITITDNTVELEYTTLENKEKVIKDICKAAQKASIVFLGSDPDREGELIAWHIGQEVANAVKSSTKIHRITFNEITKRAIEEAIQNQSTIDEHKVQAQQARRVLDRWVGYEVSPLLWKKFRKGLSAGRVQSVALRLICEREVTIKEFIPEESWSIELIGHLEKSPITFTLTHHHKKKVAPKTKAQAEALVKQLRSATLTIESINDTLRTKRPYAPFTTSTLQQAAYQQLHYKVAKTMQLAQQLYEGVPLEDEQTPIALITYMRTDSTRVSESAIKQVRPFIKTQYGADYLPQKANVYGGKKGQDAHEAIRPIDVSLTPDRIARYLEPGLLKLYTLVWKRFVASQMADAKYAQRKVIATGDGFTLSATGSTLLFDGFRAVYISADEEQETGTIVPEHIAEKSAIRIGTITPKQHFTQPPARFTEASLIKELEKEGIGRPSTYVPILKTIQARAYTELDDKKRFFPTELGIIVTKLLVEHLPKIMNVSFTAEMETELDKIAQGDLPRDKVLLDFYATFSKDLKAFRKDIGSKSLETTTITCPSCKQHALVIRFGKAGPFLGCPGFPECTFTSNFTRATDGTITLVEAPQPTLLEELCPQCGKQLRTAMGRFGPFTACSGYPECKYIKQIIAWFPCPLCGSEIAQRSWRGKIFWGCKGYPQCKFSISGDIVQKSCPSCNAPYLRKRISVAKGTLLVCPTKGCGYTVPE